MAILNFTHLVDNNPGPKEIGTIAIHTDFVSRVDIEPIIARSRYSCSLHAQEFIEDEASPRKQQLYRFLTEAGVHEDDAITIMLKLIGIARNVTSSVEYRPHYALSIWLTLYVFALSQEPIGFRPASKLIVGSLSRSMYKRKRKTSSAGDDRCTICLDEFRTGQEVVTLPCGHEFDNVCIVEWFNVSHVCPLCRFELPCEDEDEDDDDFYQVF